MAKMRPGPAKDGLKRKAMAALKRRKVYEGQRDSLLNQGFNLDQAAFVQSSLADTKVRPFARVLSLSLIHSA